MYTAPLQITRWQHLWKHTAYTRKNRMIFVVCGRAWTIYLHWPRLSETEKHKKPRDILRFCRLRNGIDSVDYLPLWFKSAACGIQGKMLYAIKAMCRNLESCVRVNGRLTDWFNQRAGLRQGYTLSLLNMQYLLMTYYRKVITCAAEYIARWHSEHLALCRQCSTDIGIIRCSTGYAEHYMLLVQRVDAESQQEMGDYHTLPKGFSGKNTTWFYIQRNDTECRPHVSLAWPVFAWNHGFHGKRTELGKNSR